MYSHFPANHICPTSRIMFHCDPIKLAILSVVLFILLVPFSVLAQSDAFAQGPPGLSDPGARGTGGGPAGGLTPTDPSVDGGSVPVGGTAQVVVLFRNEGSQPVETGQIRLYPSSNVSADVSLNQCQETPLPSGAECATAISVKGLQAGPWRVEMLMSHSGRSRLVTATLSGTIDAGADGADQLSLDIESIPESVDFGSLNASQTLVEPVILRNVTSTGLDIEDIYIDASDSAGYNLRTECERLEPGQSCIATITWSPKLKGPSTGVLVVEHTGPTALTSVIIEGEYAPDTVDQAEVFPEAVPGKGLLVSSRTEVDFGSDIETASTITVSLVNAGDAPLTISDIDISGTDNGVSFRGKGCKAGTVLEPIEACPLTVYWSPTRAGNLLDDIQIVHNGARGILVLPVRGSALNPVSQDQGSIMLSGGQDLLSGPRVMGGGPGLRTDASGEPFEFIDVEEDVSDDDIAERQERAARRNQQFTAGIPNPASVLDGLKITSFSPTRAIINGPSGSRIVFNNEPIVLGGIPWDVNIQPNGIEFTYNQQTILLLFDRSLSSINRVRTESNSRGSSGSRPSTSGTSGTTSSGTSSTSSGLSGGTGSGI